MPPPSLGRIENAIYRWKKTGASGGPYRLLDDYVHFVAATQNWTIFAPSAPSEDGWVTVLAVTGWRTLGRSPAKLPYAVPWGEDRVPIVDPIPLYSSYEGSLAGALRSPAGLYRTDPKLVENLVLGRARMAISSFAEYWSRDYRETHGRRPRGIIVMLARSKLPRPFSGVLPSSSHPDEAVLWFSDH